MTLFGAMFIAFSLPAAIFLLVIRRSAKLVIVMYCRWLKMQENKNWDGV